MKHGASLAKRPLGELQKKVRAVGARDRPAPGADELIKKISKGLSFRELEAVQSKVGLPMEELANKLSISRSTLHRRKAEGRLNSNESEKAMRFARLFDQASRIFGDAVRARAWLKFPQHGLGGAIPLDYARTETGAREVEDLLGRIDYGVYS